MLSLNPGDIPVPKLHGYLLGSVAPRPICFASTVDAEGNVNLSPYSFFNVFSANPPVMIFSPARRVRDNTVKHTLENVHETGEVVINIVTHAMVQQMSLSSTEYDKGVNEFVKAGFTEIASEVVRPPRVKESPAQFECKVKDIIALGEDGGAGNLVISEVVRLHIDEAILNEQGVIDPAKLDPVSRLGGNWYGRASKGLFEVAKPLRTLGIGVDSLPENIRTSSILTGNDLGMLGNMERMPSAEEIESLKSSSEELEAWLDEASREEIENKAKSWLQAGKVSEAFQLLMAK